MSVNGISDGETISAIASAYGPTFQDRYKITSRLAILVEDTKREGYDYKLSHLKIGCSLYSEEDVNKVYGKFVAVKRGGCAFETKTFYAQLAGATGIIVLSNDKERMTMMAALDSPEVDYIEIPSLLATKKAADYLIRKISPDRNADLILNAVDADLFFGVTNPTKFETVYVNQRGINSLTYFLAVVNIKLFDRVFEPLNRSRPYQNDMKFGLLSNGASITCLNYCPKMERTCCAMLKRA